MCPFPLPSLTHPSTLIILFPSNLTLAITCSFFYTFHLLSLAPSYMCMHAHIRAHTFLKYSFLPAYYASGYDPWLLVPIAFKCSERVASLLFPYLPPSLNLCRLLWGCTVWQLPKITVCGTRITKRLRFRRHTDLIPVLSLTLPSCAILGKLLKL